MVTRAVNFKIIVPRGKKDQSAAQALWTTHREINLATRYYEELLLSLRQKPILYRDENQRTETEASQVASDLADAARHLNNRNPLSNYDEPLDLFRRLYEAIVPSAIGEKGSAQNANQFVSPILDPESDGFLAVFEKIEDPPDWIKGVRDIADARRKKASAEERVEAGWIRRRSRWPDHGGSTLHHRR